MCKILSCLTAPNLLFCIDCLDRLSADKAVEFQTELSKIFAEHLDKELWFFTSMNPNSEDTHNPKLSPKLWVRSKIYVPDMTEIAEHHLAFEGFSEFSVLGSKVNDVWNDCKFELSKQPHYSFTPLSLRKLIQMSNMRIMRSGVLKEESAILYMLKLIIGAGLVDED
jgi:hypothetical protein